jgi:hypothetical protein
MIKRYNQFVNKGVNENAFEEDDEFGDIKTKDGSYLNPEGEEYFEEGDEFGDIKTKDGSYLNPEGEEYFEEEEEAGDFYNNKLKEVADLIGVEVIDGKVEFEGREIIFPSETEMYHVDKKKFKTAQEVADYLNTSSKVLNTERELELQESKSYRNRFRK